LSASAGSVGESLRRRIVSLLRDTAPGGDLDLPYAASLTSEQLTAAKKLFPAEQLARAAVLVPLVERPQGLQVMLTLRASHLKNHAGQVSFPGGRMESQDEGPWEAALREAREEIGLEPRYIERAGYLPDHMVITGFRVTPVVAFIAPGFALKLDRTEVDEVFEVPLEFILDPANHQPRDRQFAGLTVTTYDILYEGRQIWGATANMLISLSRLLREAAR
jgi:8-oxo-dGTP pyrophosphatase MutT (NUDIX family)